MAGRVTASSFVNGQAIAVDGGLITGPLYREQHARIEALLQLLHDTPVLTGARRRAQAPVPDWSSA